MYEQGCVYVNTGGGGYIVGTWVCVYVNTVGWGVM